MRALVKDLMDSLGVGYILSAYETAPWSAYDDDEGLTCSAEVRMSSDADEMEAEIQFMYDEPTPDKKRLIKFFGYWQNPPREKNGTSSWSKLKAKTKQKIFSIGKPKLSNFLNLAFKI